MTINEKQSIDRLLLKYNAVLVHSMSIAVAEDFVNLIIINNDDEHFELNHLLKNKDMFRTYVTSQFLKINASSLALELRQMEEVKFSLNKKIKTK